jgi:hypothetical protein
MANTVDLKNTERKPLINYVQGKLSCATSGEPLDPIWSLLEEMMEKAASAFNLEAETVDFFAVSASKIILRQKNAWWCMSNS